MHYIPKSLKHPNNIQNTCVAYTCNYIVVFSEQAACLFLLVINIAKWVLSGCLLVYISLSYLTSSSV